MLRHFLQKLPDLTLQAAALEETNYFVRENQQNQMHQLQKLQNEVRQKRGD